VNQGPSYYVDLQKSKKVEGTEDEWERQGGRMVSTFSPYDRPDRLRSGESTVFAVGLEPDDRSIKLSARIGDRRGRKKKEFWSPRFPIPGDLFVSPRQ